VKVLLDECMPVRLRSLLPGHDVYTVGFMQWKGISNGRLLSIAKADGFHAIVTSDKAVEVQQNLVTLPLSVLILHPVSNAIDDILPLVPGLLARLGEVTDVPTVLHVRR
jgi:predicted nuclease of predicted toxin-antitoxin system